MARPLRIEYPGAWYHVLNRGRRRERIFFSDNDCELFFKILGECTKLFDVEIHAYSLIPNHYHLLVHTPRGNLSRGMRHLNGVYTQAINRKYKHEGSLFKGRFKSILIEKESYLQELVRYIHRNPYKSKLEKEIGQHKWTSHSAYMNRHKCPRWLKTEDVLTEFGDYEKEAMRQLDAFVKKEVPQELSAVLNRVKWPAILGGESFKNDIKERLRGKKIERKEVPQYKESMAGLSADEAIRMIEDTIGEKDVFARKKSKKHSLKRKAIAYICREYLYASCPDICAALGGISCAALSKQFRLASEEIKRKEGCYKDFKKMAGILKLIVKT